MSNGKGIAAIGLIIAGVVLLMDNLGVLARLEFSASTLLWPLMFIGAGLWLVAGAVRGLRNPEPEELERSGGTPLWDAGEAVPGQGEIVALDGATSAQVKIVHGAGRLSVGPGAPPGALLAGNFAGIVSRQTRRVGDRLDVVLSIPGGSASWRKGAPGGMEWDVRLTGEAPLALGFEMGASRSRLDLRELRVTGLSVQIGAGDAEIDLPAAAGATYVKVEGGAARITLHVPGGVAALVRTNAGLSHVTVDETRFPRIGGAYRSPDFESAPNKVIIAIDAAVGRIQVD
jgi:hypothetical protein